MRRWVVHGLWTVSLIVVMGGSLKASQTTTSQLDGSVKDQTGAVISAAVVTLTSLDTNEALVQKANQDGLFVFPQIRRGWYRLTVKAPGFKRAVVDGIKVEVGIPATVTVILEVGEITDVIEVTASEGQAVINTVNAELNTIITRRQILDLPLNGRNPLQLAGLQAGVATNTTVRGAAVNGLRGSYNNLTQDGINIQDNFIRTDGFFGITAPSVENVAEFSITTQNIGPDAGIGVAQVKLITPSGTNEYHGSAFWFHRNTILDANDFFNNLNGLSREKLIRNQFGYRMGGPIFKDTLFFFGYYQGTRERRSDTVLRSVLSIPARQGLFTYRRADNGQLETVNLLALAGLEPDPLIAGRLGLTPDPNDFTVGDDFNFAGFRFNSSVVSDNDLWGFRIDYAPTPEHQFEAVFQQFHSRFPNDTFNDIGETFPGLPGGGQSSLRQLGSYAWRWTPTAALTNELRWGFQRAPVQFTNTQSFSEGFRVGFPITSNPVRNFLPQGRNAPVYELIDNVNFIKGNHSLRFGGHVRWVDAGTFNFGGVIPLFQLGFGGINANPISQGDFPGGIRTDDFNNASAILALLSGTIESGSQTFNVTTQTSGFVADAPERRNLKQRFLSFYGGDTWRVRPRFTVNVGLRWEWHTVPVEDRGLALLPSGGVAGLRDPQAVLDFAGEADGRGFFDDDLNNFAPSFGFAWSPSFEHGLLKKIFGGRNRTSLRGGYSISYVVDSDFTAVQNAFSANAGLQQTVTSFSIPGTISELMAGRQTSLPQPEFMVPRTLADNLATDPFAGLFTIDEGLRTPYVQQWTLSLERQIFRDTAIEIRYVGNRGTKLIRAIDVNQVDVVNNGFAQDVLRARQNIQECGRPDPRGCGQPLQVFPLLAFRGRPVLRNATVLNEIMQGVPGDIVIFFLQNRDSVFNPRAGAKIGPDFFFPNGNALFADFVGNNSWSTYHALQFEARHRFSQGLWFQFNYTYGRAFTDFAGTAANFDAFLDIRRPELEKRRPNFDVTHTVNLNVVYELPIGQGHRFLTAPGGVWGKLLSGWQINGILQGRSGPPISIISGRATFNRTGRNDSNTVFTTLTRDQLRKMTGLFHLPDTGEPVLFDPRLIGPDGRADPEFFMNPDAGQVGALGLTPVSGPQFFNVDFSVIKRTRWKTFLNESTEVEFRAEFFNVFNNTNFAQGFFQDAFGNIPENINSTNFGRIVAAFPPRIIQFALKVNF